LSQLITLSRVSGIVKVLLLFVGSDSHVMPDILEIFCIVLTDKKQAIAMKRPSEHIYRSLLPAGPRLNDCSALFMPASGLSKVVAREALPTMDRDSKKTREKALGHASPLLARLGLLQVAVLTVLSPLMGNGGACGELQLRGRASEWLSCSCLADWCYLVLSTVLFFLPAGSNPMVAPFFLSVLAINPAANRICRWWRLARRPRF
jgi:hypothetical protein